MVITFTNAGKRSRHCTRLDFNLSSAESDAFRAAATLCASCKSAAMLRASSCAIDGGGRLSLQDRRRCAEVAHRLPAASRRFRRRRPAVLGRPHARGRLAHCARARDVDRRECDGCAPRADEGFGLVQLGAGRRAGARWAGDRIATGVLSGARALESSCIVPQMCREQSAHYNTSLQSRSPPLAVSDATWWPCCAHSSRAC